MQSIVLLLSFHIYSVTVSYVFGSLFSCLLTQYWYWLGLIFLSCDSIGISILIHVKLANHKKVVGCLYFWLEVGWKFHLCDSRSLPLFLVSLFHTVSHYLVFCHLPLWLNHNHSGLGIFSWFSFLCIWSRPSQRDSPCQQAGTSHPAYVDILADNLRTRCSDSMVCKPIQ